MAEKHPRMMVGLSDGGRDTEREGPSVAEEVPRVEPEEIAEYPPTLRTTQSSCEHSCIAMDLPGPMALC